LIQDWTAAAARVKTMALPKFNQLVEGIDFYREGDKVVFTSIYHLKRGSCCHSKCRHCPYGLGTQEETFSLAVDPLPTAPLRPKGKGST
jgi:hypothetical protein